MRRCTKDRRTSRAAVVWLGALLGVALGGCGDDDGESLANQNDAQANGGSSYQCVVDCSDCLLSVRDRCEGAAAACRDPNCCLQARRAFDCGRPPTPPACSFDCGQCLEAADRGACFNRREQCGSEPAEDRSACCDDLEATFAGCGESTDPDLCFDCTQCDAQTDRDACTAAVDACESQPPSERALCCATLGDLIPECVEQTVGACGVDCDACPLGQSGTCETVQSLCEDQSGPQRIQCCAEVLSTYGGICGASGTGSCDVDCRLCPTPTGQAACRSARNACDNRPDPDRAEECCRQLEANLDFVCGGL